MGGSKLIMTKARKWLRRTFATLGLWILARAKQSLQQQRRRKRLLSSHQQQDDKTRRRKKTCQAIAKSIGKQCRNRPIVGGKYCSCHQQRQQRFSSSNTGTATLAIGLMQWLGRKLLARRLFQAIPRGTTPTTASSYRRCTASILRASQHQKKTKKKLVHHGSSASGTRNKTDTAEFRIPNLHRTRAVAVKVWDLRNHRDAYSGRTRHQMMEQQEMMGGGGQQILNLDHVLELHIVRDAFDRVRPSGLLLNNRGSRENSSSSSSSLLKSRLSTLLNQPNNLNFTTSEINQIKFRGLYNFQRDYYYNNNNSVPSETGLVHYLKTAHYGQQRLSRKTTANIQKEIVRSYDAVTSGLYEEDPMQRQVLDLLHSNLTAMRVF